MKPLVRGGEGKFIFRRKCGIYCENLTVSDLIKNIWKVKIEDPNYELF